MREYIDFKGYHGTVKYNVSSILEEGFKIEKYSFLTSNLQKVPGDLGAGAYAYKDEPKNAERFAEKFNGEVAVFELSLQVKKDRYLDMDKESNASLILEVYNSKAFKTLESRYERTNKSSSNRKCLDGLILEYIIHKHKIEVDLVKKETYTQFKGLPPISQYSNGTELCIKNEAVIRNIKEYDVSTDYR